ncbi:response regulator transcription factor [Telmatospirillum sp.]|uniref:response regulator transcription factor n=1 Tax=Telmatospirillum sp. TaxID=2079197 RepID=UPI00284C108B|nr:response regulator transcription factor [Telmatospirillum sp.]MDR3439401.1 response regulator transcription factor [Telmatospirillum sp.]
MAGGRPKILIVEDDADLRGTVAFYLAEQGFDVVEAVDGREMQARLDSVTSLVLLDVNLPGEDGFTLARELRSRSSVGIIMITGRTDLVDRVVGLEVGADDYIAKPFPLRELLARIKALLRRLNPAPIVSAPAEVSHVIRFDDWVLNTQRQELVAPDGAEVGLTTMEFSILYRLALPPGHTVSRQELCEALKGRDWSPLERSIDVHVGNLRRKLEANGRYPRLIKSVHGIGYRLAVDSVAK